MTLKDKIRQSLEIHKIINHKDFYNLGYRGDLKNFKIKDILEFYYYNDYSTRKTLFVFVKNNNEIICDDIELQNIVCNFEKYKKLLCFLS